MLGDVDRQQSSRLWLQQRPEAARPIVRWNLSADEMERPPKDAAYAVLDTPAGLHGKLLKEVLKLADRIVVPLQASVFDIFATQEFLTVLAEHRHSQGVPVGIVGMRVDGRTLASEQLHQFLEGLGLPVLGYLRDTQNYVHLAAHGLSLFDVAPGRVARDLEQWQGICEWLDS
ncbi:hypothetical protein SDC9_182450 [bioreactor metagenome]|uniref:CobQ/CobB/MinD/ParA nucleotide binding domain-containing protein n=1 Tax=bioreactor metagenome TaxID=1076179 RepID=A0A645H8W2_9ZZZZ